MSSRAEKIRWRIAYLIDRFTRQCWADLVSWARGDKRGIPAFSSKTCRAEVSTIGRCYCGKFRRTDAESGISTPISTSSDTCASGTAGDSRDGVRALEQEGR